MEELKIKATLENVKKLEKLAGNLKLTTSQ